MKHDGSVFGALLPKDETRILSWSDDRTVRLRRRNRRAGPAMKHDGSVFGALLSSAEDRPRPVPIAEASAAAKSMYWSLRIDSSGDGRRPRKRAAESAAHGCRTRLRLLHDREVAQHPLEALLIGVVILPAPEIADVAIQPH
jgi:hypothetical protein